MGSGNYHETDETGGVEDPLVGFDGRHPAVGVVEERPHCGVDHRWDHRKSCRKT